MDNLFLIIFLLSALALIAGMVKPDSVDEQVNDDQEKILKISVPF